LSRLEIGGVHGGEPAGSEFGHVPRVGRALSLCSWGGAALHVREIASGDIRVWHPDGSYFGRLIPDAAHTIDAPSGAVFGLSGVYLADSVAGRLRVDPHRLKLTPDKARYPLDAFDSPGPLSRLEAKRVQPAPRPDTSRRA
jgi:hypothetical protein